MTHLRFLWVCGIIVLWSACSKEKYDIEYQEGYPNLFADNWIAFEFQGGNLEGDFTEPYDMVTSLDPNHENSLILDKLYHADVRVRAACSDTAFSVTLGDNLDTVNQNNYHIRYISLKGYITTNPVLTDMIYRAALSYYQNASITPKQIQDVLFMRAGYYDSLQLRIDTVLVIAYRKTGFEDVDYQP